METDSRVYIEDYDQSEVDRFYDFTTMMYNLIFVERPMHPTIRDMPLFINPRVVRDDRFPSLDGDLNMFGGRVVNSYLYVIEYDRNTGRHGEKETYRMKCCLESHFRFLGDALQPKTEVHEYVVSNYRNKFTFQEHLSDPDIELYVVKLETKDVMNLFRMWLLLPRERNNADYNCRAEFYTRKLKYYQHLKFKQHQLPFLASMTLQRRFLNEKDMPEAMKDSLRSMDIMQMLLNLQHQT